MAAPEWGIEISHEAEMLIARLNNAPRISADLIEKNLRTVGGTVAAKERLVLDVVKYKGALARGVSTEYTASYPNYQIKIAPTGAHARAVRTGTRPHWVPLGVLKEWARWKLGDESAAYPIQKSIAKKGTSVWLERKGLGERTNYGVGYDYPGRTLQRGDVQLVIERTSQRIPLDLIALLEGKNP